MKTLGPYRPKCEASESEGFDAREDDNCKFEHVHATCLYSLPLLTERRHRHQSLRLQTQHRKAGTLHASRYRVCTAWLPNMPLSA